MERAWFCGPGPGLAGAFCCFNHTAGLAYYLSNVGKGFPCHAEYLIKLGREFSAEIVTAKKELSHGVSSDCWVHLTTLQSNMLMNKASEKKKTNCVC